MICSTFLEEITSRLNDLINRGRATGGTLTDAQLNWKPGDGLWTIGQIFSHMHIPAARYVPEMELAIENAKFGREDAEVKHTVFGSMIIKASGPSGNTPAPKAMIPGPGSFGQEVVETFVADHTRVIQLAEKSQSIDLIQTKIKNPFLPLFRMNMADCFEIVTCHAERHVGQIEQLMRREGFPTE
ncbi:MAG: DinB family protein [Fimbriimonas sp.]